MTGLHALVTVLMPVYNGEKFLREAVNSILAQTYENFELLIIDDGSTDKSPEIVSSYSDPRIRLVQNGQNKGVIFSLNKGLKLARGKYIARMDADDISLPERLKRQVAYMEGHREVGVCGTWTTLFTGPAKLAKITMRFPKDSQTIKAMLIFENVIQHPSVMLRNSMLRKTRLSYSRRFIHAEDYGLWISLLNKTEFAVIDETLLLYRLHPASIGQRFAKLQLVSVGRIHRTLLAKIGVVLSQDEFNLHEDISFGRYDQNRAFVDRSDAWLSKLKDCGVSSKVLGRRWFAVCLGCIALGPWVWGRFWQSPLGKASRLNFNQKFRFWLIAEFFPFIKPVVFKIKHRDLFKYLHRKFLD